jgi:tryptophan halogenase
LLVHFESNNMNRIMDILVVGGGCAGLLAAVNLKAKLPTLNVQLLRHPIVGDFSLDVLATTPALPTHLHGELGVPLPAFVQAAQPTFTLGARYEWGPRDFFDYTYEFQLDTKYAKLNSETGFYISDGPKAFEAVGAASALMSAGRVFLRDAQGRPQINIHRFGYHLDRRVLEALLEAQAGRLGVIFREGRMAEAIRSDEGIAAVRLESGEVVSADLFIDATGLESLLLGKAMATPFHSFAAGLACDRAVIGNWLRTTEPIQPYTSVRAMDAGWCWRVDQRRMISCGHVFSSAHVDPAQAEASLRALYPKCGDTRILSFTQGRYDQSWNGNVVGIGNAAAFLEPLASAGTGVLAFQCQWFAQTLVDCDGIVRPTQRKQFNKRWQRLVEGEREFLSLFYRFNNRDELFWRRAREHSPLGDLEMIVKCYEDIGPDPVHRITLLHEHDPIGFEGYYSVLVGQKVPWNKRWQPSAQELEAWQIIQDTWRHKAAMGFTVEEATSALLGAPVMQGQGEVRRVMQPVT